MQATLMGRTLALFFIPRKEVFIKIQLNRKFVINLQLLNYIGH